MLLPCDRPGAGRVLSRGSATSEVPRTFRRLAVYSANNRSISSRNDVCRSPSVFEAAAATVAASRSSFITTSYEGCRARDVSVNADVPASGGTASATAKRVPRDQTRTHSKTFESPAGIERRTCFTGAEPHSALCADTHCRGVHDESRFQRVSVEGEPVEAFISSCPPSRSPTTSVEVSTGSVRSPAGLFHTMRRDRAAQR